MTQRWVPVVLLLVLLAGRPLAEASPLAAAARGEGLASAWFSAHGLEADLEGSLEIDFLGLTLRGFGRGEGLLDVRTLSGWAWAVVWAGSTSAGASDAQLVGGFAVEDSPAVGSGSVEGTCYFVLRRAGLRVDYRGTFVTQATSRLVPPVRPGTLALEGKMTLALSLTPCTPTAGFPWDSDRWPPELLAELLGRCGP